MNIDHLEERVIDYRKSIETVVDKKTHWKTQTRELLLATLGAIVKKYKIGWSVQELKWIHNSEAVNISFKSFPPELIDCTNRIPEYQFIPGGALVFSQTYSGDVLVFVLFPTANIVGQEKDMVEIGMFSPIDINEKFIIERTDDFLQEMIKWELPSSKKKMGY